MQKIVIGTLVVRIPSQAQFVSNEKNDDEKTNGTLGIRDWEMSQLISCLHHQMQLEPPAFHTSHQVLTYVDFEQFLEIAIDFFPLGIISFYYCPKPIRQNVGK